MAAENDRTGRVHNKAVRADFKDGQMVKLIKNPGFTIPRFTIQANRLLGAKDASPDAASDAEKAQAILNFIEKSEE